jgi:hypothetical protein
MRVDRTRALTLAFIGCLAATPAARADTLVIGDFSNAGLAGWEAHSFKGETDYEVVELGGTRVVKAASRGAASILFRKQRIDLRQTPYLEWRWRIEDVIEGADEREKRGDDYPARVYVVREGGLFAWRTRSVNYVWSSSQPVGAEWPNAYTDQAQMVAVRSGRGEAGDWVEERRNVLDDFRRLFGEEIDYVDGVALMTDTDDTDSEATAFYGDIRFTSE